jgi:hypothetical protein
MAPALQCTSCSTSLEGGAVYFHTRVTIEGEQEIGELQSGEAPQDLLARMVEEGDWDRYADEVHWEISGKLCGDCRTRLREALAPFFSEVEVSESVSKL